MSNFPSLKAAAEGKLADVKKATSFQVAPLTVEIEPGFNRPINRENVEQFKVSIRNGATIPPIMVRVDAGRIIMVDGEHRLIAVRELVEEGVSIPYMDAIQFRGNDADRVAHLVTSAQGQPISPLDLGVQYLKLIRLGWDRKMIADRIGRTVGHVDQNLMLAESNTDVQGAIRRGEVSGTLAATVIKTHGSGAGRVIAEKVAAAKADGKPTKVKRADVVTKPSALVALRKLVDGMSVIERHHLDENSTHNPGATDCARAVLITPAVWDVIKAALG